MNKLTLKCVQNVRTRATDGRFRKCGYGFSPRKSNFAHFRRKCQAANRRIPLHAENRRTFFFFLFYVVFSFCFATRLLPPHERGDAAKICCDSRSRERAYCAQIVMTIRYGLFVQKLFRACRPEKEPIYPQQICIALSMMASALWAAPTCRDSCRNADKYLSLLFSANKHVANKHVCASNISNLYSDLLILIIFIFVFCINPYGV